MPDWMRGTLPSGETASMSPFPGIAGGEYFRARSRGGGYVKAHAQLPAAQDQMLIGDPEDIMVGQLQREIESLKNQQSSLADQITKKTQYKLETLEREHRIKIKALQEKHLGPTPEGKTAQDQLDRYNEALQDLESGYALAQNREMGKIQPDLDALAAGVEQQRQQIQSAFQEKEIALRILEELEDSGTIESTAAMQKKWQLAGYNLPVSAFAAAPPTPEEELQEVNYYIRMLESELPKTLGGTQSFISPVFVGEGGRERLNEIRTRLLELKSHRLGLVEQQLQRVAPKSRALAGVARKQLSANRPSTLAGRISIEKEKDQTRGGKPIYQRSKRTGQVRVSYDGGRTWQMQ